MSTVLVIGGTGLVGRPTVEQLLKNHHTVYSVSRAGRPVADEIALAADLGQAGWVTALKAIDRPVDVLVHTTFSTSADRLYDHRINVDSFKEAVDAVNPAQVVYVSSVGALGSDLPSGDYSENSPRVGDSDYARDKIEAAAYLESQSPRIRATVLLPSNVYNRDSARVRYYRTLLSQGYFVYKHDGRGTYNIVHADDVAQAIVLAISRTEGPAFDEFVVNGEHLEFRTWIERIESMSDLSARPKLPQGLEGIIRGPIRSAVARLGVRSPMRIPEPKATTYEAKIAYRSEKIAQDLGWAVSRFARDVLS